MPTAGMIGSCGIVGGINMTIDPWFYIGWLILIGIIMLATIVAGAWIRFGLSYVVSRVKCLNQKFRK